jgi:hypothetical protein
MAPAPISVYTVTEQSKMFKKQYDYCLKFLNCSRTFLSLYEEQSEPVLQRPDAAPNPASGSAPT